MAAQIVAGYANATLNVQQTNSGTNPAGNLAGLVQMALQYTNGTGAVNTCDQIYAKQTTLASTTQTLHFQTATANDPFGNTLAMLRIHELIIQNLSVATSAFLKVSASASNGIAWLPLTASYIPVRPGGVLWISDPLSFGAAIGNFITSTTDGLTIDSVANTITFNIVVVGSTVA